MEIFKVSSKSSSSKVAGAIASQIKKCGKAEVHAIGAGAVNQAVKAIAIARGYVAPMGKDLVCVPTFKVTTIDGEERSGMIFVVREV